MAIRYTLRLQFGLQQDPAAIGERLVRLFRDLPADEAMVFFFGEELNDGHESIPSIKEWIEHSRVYRTRLSASGIAISLNPVHTLLHAAGLAARQDAALARSLPWFGIRAAHGWSRNSYATSSVGAAWCGT